MNISEYLIYVTSSLGILKSSKMNEANTTITELVITCRGKEIYTSHRDWNKIREVAWVYDFRYFDAFRVLYLKQYSSSVNSSKNLFIREFGFIEWGQESRYKKIPDLSSISQTQSAALTWVSISAFKRNQNSWAAVVELSRKRKLRSELKLQCLLGYVPNSF